LDSNTKALNRHYRPIAKSNGLSRFPVSDAKPPPDVFISFGDSMVKQTLPTAFQTSSGAFCASNPYIHQGPQKNCIVV